MHQGSRGRALSGTAAELPDAGRRGGDRYTDIRVGSPNVEEEMISHEITPQECRLREMTYSATIVGRAGYQRSGQA